MDMNLNDFNLENEVNLENARLRIDIVIALLDRYCESIFDINNSKGYALYSTVIDMSCEALEHYFKYILRNMGYGWNDLKKVSHNLSELYQLLPAEIKEKMNHKYLYFDIDECLNLLNNVELKEKYLLYNHLANSSAANRSDKMKYNKIRIDIFKQLYKIIDECIEQKDYTLLINAIKNGLYFYKFDDDGQFEVLKHLSMERDLIFEELKKLSSSGGQLINISSRYPGYKNIRANISFLTSLSICIDKIINDQLKKTKDDTHYLYN